MNKECKSDLGNFKGFLMVRLYSHIMSNKIRRHLQFKHLKQYNLTDESINNILDTL